MNSTTDKISGKTKEMVGKATNNKTLQAKGKAQETVGKVKSGVSEATDKIYHKM